MGSACLAIGFSLPVALFYQLRAEAESLGIIDACRQAGIRAIFRSRHSDASELRVAIDAAAASSSRIDLLGVAFPSLFNPSGEHTDRLIERLDDHRVPLRILLLDPDSEAAKRRAEIEKGNETRDHIRFTLDHGIPAMIQERMRHLCQERGFLCRQDLADSNEPSTDGSSEAGLTDHAAHASLTEAIGPSEPAGAWSAKLASRVKPLSNCQVRTYDLEPMAFLMIFDGSIFTEQYHLGRPARLLRARSCIGGHVPVIEYSGNAQASQFLREHFEALWAESKRKDVTLLMTQKAAAACYQPGGAQDRCVLAP